MAHFLFLDMEALVKVWPYQSLCHITNRLLFSAHQMAICQPFIRILEKLLILLLDTLIRLFRSESIKYAAQAKNLILD